MIYGFNDKKEKVEVVKARDFVYYETEISGVSPSGVSGVSITQDELGIADIENWMIVSVYQYSTSHVWNRVFRANYGDYPKAQLNESGQNIYITVYNASSSQRKIPVRVLLKRVAP
jgi:hypothetical protein